MKLYQIKSEEIAGWWENLKPIIWQSIKAFEVDDLYGAEDLKRLIKSGDMQCWVSFSGDESLESINTVGITQIAQYPKCKVLQIVAAACEKDSNWGACSSIVFDWARANKCKYYEISGRKGWAKIFPEAKQLGIHLRGIL